MSVFYLVRHAHANWTPDENRPLSAQGLADAQRVADLLASCPIDAVYASPARRAWQTVELLAVRLGLPIHPIPDLRERELAGGPVDDFLAAVKAAWDNPTQAHPGGESNVVAQRRGVAVVLQLSAQHPDGHLVLGTHGNLLALVLQYFYPTMGYDFWQSLTMPDVYRLDLGLEGATSLERLWK